MDHFSKFAETVPCSHHDYDAVTTSRLLLQKWFARHGTPTCMQLDNAPNLTAEVSNEFLKAAHVTKVTSTAGHPRTQGLVERQNRTLLTLLRVFCLRRMRDWDQCLDEVMGAYNSTRHATTGFSPYMLTRGVEKAIPLTFLYPEFAAKSFDTHESYVDHVLARQQEIHDLVRRNTHQAQLRQKLKYDRTIRARAYRPGELVWVFCRYVPPKRFPQANACLARSAQNGTSFPRRPRIRAGHRPKSAFRTPQTTSQWTARACHGTRKHRRSDSLDGS